MRYGVDGKASERGARLRAIGCDHLSDLGHEFGRNYQLRYHRPEVAWGAVVGHGENEATAGADPLDAHQRLAERVRDAEGFERFGAHVSPSCGMPPS
jgi:hypothetical protein